MTSGVVGLVLAAGEGRRLGQPKALVEGGDGRTWLTRTVDVLHEAGVDDVCVVIGAAAELVAAAAPATARIVRAPDWAEGMGASLRAGLAAVAETPRAESVVVMLVDTPDIGASVVQRVLEQASPAALVRAAYHGRPGHPVVLGSEHWTGVAAAASGDRGARDYLGAHDVVNVECGDLATGVDVDTAAALAAWRADS